MALIKCKECGQRVSSKAKNCPNCGAPVTSGGCGIGCVVILIGIVMIIFASMISRCNSDSQPIQTEGGTTSFDSWKTSDNSTMAYIMMMDFVKQKLKAPKTAEFPGVFDGRADHITYLGNQKYKIISYVDSQNSFGALIRNHFVGEIEQVAEDKWKLNALVFIEP
ncbi:MAG: zinc ribbon domain-containing protein [Candidatus Zixiibacteriota bacterium]